MAGKLFLIGAGPGDPELITLRAIRALGQCDVVLYDRLVAKEILAHAKPGAELLYVGKRHGEQELVQDEIFQSILEHALAGKIVGRLKGGDPVVFGRGAEEWAVAAESGIAVEIIPGVTSAVAVPELAGIPMTYRKISRSFTIITGHEREDQPLDWQTFAHVDTLIILMGVKNRVSIAEALIAAGRRPATPVAFIERGTTAQEHAVIATLGDVAEGKVHATNPAVWVVGEVVRLRAKLRGSLAH